MPNCPCNDCVSGHTQRRTVFEREQLKKDVVRLDVERARAEALFATAQKVALEKEKSR